MAGRPSSARVVRLAKPLKLLTQRFAYFALLLLALALLGVGRADPRIMERGRSYIVDASVPILSALARPLETASMAVDHAHAMIDLYSENVALREENMRLRDWQTAARRLEQENTALRGLMALRPEPRTTVAAARVIADGGGPFVRTLVIDAGIDAGVEDGHVVVDGVGVVGRVTAAGARSARVLLLTDLNSRIPVRIEGTRLRAVLAGDNTDRPRLVFLPSSAKVRAGDRLVTSGDGGLFPAGLPIGIIESIGPEGVHVRPWSSLDALEFIRVVRYDARPLAVDGIEDEDATEPHRLVPKAPVTVDPATVAAPAQAAAPEAAPGDRAVAPAALPPAIPPADPSEAASDRPE